MKSLLHDVVRRLKTAVYGARGEPYEFAGQTLRFVPGTRPVRLKYVNSENGVVRYDAREVQTLLNEVKAGETLLDIGAHTGEYCVLMSALAGPTGQVVAFEPDHYARGVMDQNIALNPGVRAPIVESLAVSDSEGEAVLFSKGGNANSSLVSGATGGSADVENESLAVKLTTLDRYLSDKGLKPDWAKIDTEGAEIRILKGATQLLKSDCRFLVELHPYAWDEFGNTFAELQAIVAAAGRRMRYIDHTEALTADPRYGVVALDKI